MCPVCVYAQHSGNFTDTCRYLCSLCDYLLVDKESDTSYPDCGGHRPKNYATSTVGVNYIGRTSDMSQIYPKLARRLGFASAQVQRYNCLSTSCSDDASTAAEWIHMYDALAWRRVAERYACDLAHFNPLFMGDVEDAHELLRTRRWPNATGKAPISHDENLKGELAMMLQRWRTPTDKDVLTAKHALEHLEHLDEIA